MIRAAQTQASIQCSPSMQRGMRSPVYTIICCDRNVSASGLLFQFPDLIMAISLHLHEPQAASQHLMHRKAYYVCACTHMYKSGAACN